ITSIVLPARRFRRYSAASRRTSGYSPSSFRTSTRSLPTRAIASSNVVRGERRSVTTMAFKRAGRRVVRHRWQTHERRGGHVAVNDSDDLDTSLERADARNFGEVGSARDNDARKSARARRGKDLGAIGARLTEKRERVSQIFERQP